jgi:hypothetical protein
MASQRPLPLMNAAVRSPYAFSDPTCPKATCVSPHRSSPQKAGASPVHSRLPLLLIETQSGRKLAHGDFESRAICDRLRGKEPVFSEFYVH